MVAELVAGDVNICRGPVVDLRSSLPSAVDGTLTPAINVSNPGSYIGRMANEDRLSGDCSLTPTLYSAHAKNRPWYLPEKTGFPGWCVRVCRPYDSCMSFGNQYNDQLVWAPPQPLAHGCQNTRTDETLTHSRTTRPSLERRPAGCWEAGLAWHVAAARRPP